MSNSTTENHTQGPWQAVKWTCHAATTIKAGDVVVAECSGFGRYADESLADARLIAAAPDLLAALQEIVKNDPYNQSSSGIIARAAIAKATGAAE